MANSGRLHAWIGEVGDVGSESLKITAATIALAAVLAAGFIFGGRMLLGSTAAPVAATATADPPLGAQYRDWRVATPPAEISPPPFGPPALPSLPAEDESDAAPLSESIDQPADPADEVAEPPSSPLTELAPISAPPVSARPVPSGSARGTQRVAGGEMPDVVSPAGTGEVPREFAALGTGAGRPVTLPTSVRSASEPRDTAPRTPQAVPNAPEKIGTEDVMGVPSRQRDALQRLSAKNSDLAIQARPSEQAGDVSPHSWDTAEAEAAASTTTGYRDRPKSSTKARTLSHRRHGWPWRGPSASNHRVEAETPGATPELPGTASVDLPQRAAPSSVTAVNDGEAGRQPEAGSARKDTQRPPKQRQQDKKEKDKDKDKDKDATRPEPAQAAAEKKDRPNPHSDVTKRPPKKATPPKAAANSGRRQESRDNAAAAPDVKRKSKKHAAAVGKSGAKDKAVTQPPRPSKADDGNGRGKKAKRP